MNANQEALLALAFSFLVLLIWSLCRSSSEASRLEEMREEFRRSLVNRRGQP